MRKVFVVGHPIAHSRSPLIHGSWLAEHGIEGTYERLDVAPTDFQAFLETFAARGYAGGNVTIPHKEAAFAGVERRTGRAERLKAVNTLWVEDGRLWGDNTDGLGFMAHLDQELGPGWEDGVETALVLGAGGASRAVIAGLIERPIGSVLVANRTPDKVEALARDLGLEGDPRLRPVPWDGIAAAVREAGLVVNTTSLGMTGQPALDLDLTGARAGTIVSDIVYVPLQTPLLAAAQARGLPAVDGLGMLLHQAVPGFARWFGVTPQVTPALRAVIVADIEGRR
jgi:shikimate dehydrogenase